MTRAERALHRLRVVDQEGVEPLRRAEAHQIYNLPRPPTGLPIHLLAAAKPQPYAVADA